MPYAPVFSVGSKSNHGLFSQKRKKSTGSLGQAADELTMVTSHFPPLCLATSLAGSAVMPFVIMD